MYRPNFRLLDPSRNYNIYFIWGSITLVLIWAFMFFLNSITPYVWDDYVYKFRFDNGELITSVRDILPSLRAHAQLYNGRLVSHAFAHLFLLLPKACFNFFNAALYTLLIFLISFFSGVRPKKDMAAPFFLLAIFCFLWLYSPSFGQVYLWLDGSCNYLWAITFNLLFLVPFWRHYSSGIALQKPVSRFLFVIFAFFCGAFQENMSAATIFLCAAFLLLGHILHQRKFDTTLCFSLMFAVLGLIFMATRPAEANKMSGFSFDGFLRSANSVYWSFRNMWFPFFLYIITFSLSLFLRRDKLLILDSLVFFAAAVGGNLLMLFASFYPARCAAPTMVLLTIAEFILLKDLCCSRRKTFFYLFLALLLFLTVFPCFSGVTDLLDTHREIRLREEFILQCREQNILDVSVPVYSSRTKYSPLYLELSQWPGDFSISFMAKYYGLNSLSTYVP